MSLRAPPPARGARGHAPKPSEDAATDGWGAPDSQPPDSETDSAAEAQLPVTQDVLDGLVSRMPELAGWPNDLLLAKATELLEAEATLDPDPT